MGERREVSIISHRRMTKNDLKQERSFFRGSVSTFLQLVAAQWLERCTGIAEVMVRIPASLNFSEAEVAHVTMIIFLHLFLHPRLSSNKLHEIHKF